jgi:prephenate dehydratase
LDESGVEEALAAKNEEVLPMVIGHGGYGAIAMETRAQGRVDPPLNSFIELLMHFKGTEDCPVTVLGAVRMQINFSLMARPGKSMSELTKVLAHPKSVGACRDRLKRMGVQVTEANSNGEAAREVAQNPAFENAGALGPSIAATKYDLSVLAESFEDQLAVTTFFLLGPRSHQPPVLGNAGRSLIAFRTEHMPGALVDVLTPFKTAGLNLMQIHSLYTSNGEYDFAIEVEVNENQRDAHDQAILKAKSMARCIVFGPFPVL